MKKSSGPSGKKRWTTLQKQEDYNSIRLFKNNIQRKATIKQHFKEV